MSKKIGRPKVLKRNAKAVLIGARFSPPEAKQVEKAADLSGQDKSKWIRNRLLGPAKQPIPVNCPDAQKKYDGQPAVFYFMDGKEKVPLQGRFRVWLNPTGVAVLVGGNWEDYYFHLPQVAVDSIRPVPGKPGAWEIQEPFASFPKRQ